MKSDNSTMKKLDPKRLVGIVTEIKCSKCKEIYYPDKKDISLNCSLYYKYCKQCRQHGLELKRKYDIRKRN